MSDIEKLNSVKFNIRKALESQGSGITADTPFEEYPSYIMGGSGGGSGLPEITPGDLTVVFAEQSVSFSGPAGGPYVGMLQGVSIASGVTYTVTWNGTTYTCVGSEISMDGETGVFVGNLSIYGIGENTGEPFLFTYGSGLTGTNVITTTAGPHTIGVTTGTPQTPADGSVMIVQNGAWVAASLADLVHAIEK